MWVFTSSILLYLSYNSIKYSTELSIDSNINVYCSSLCELSNLLKSINSKFKNQNPRSFSFLKTIPSTCIINGILYFEKNLYFEKMSNFEKISYFEKNTKNLGQHQHNDDRGLYSS